MSGLAVWNEVSVALYCADIALPDPHPRRTALGVGATARAVVAAVPGGSIPHQGEGPLEGHCFTRKRRVGKSIKRPPSREATPLKVCMGH